MDESKTKKMNFVLGMTSLALMACGLILYSGIYESILTEKKEVVTIGFFSDSYWEVQNGYSYRILDDAIRIFEAEHPGVSVKYTSGILKEDYSEWLSGEILSGNGPDVFLVLGEDFNDFAETGVLKNLTPLMEKDNEFRKEEYYSSALAYGQYQNRQCALPYECAPKLMFVNKTLLDREGIPVPEEDWTWDDMYEICKRVTKDTDGNGLSDQFGVFGYTWEDAFESNGVSIFNQDGTECRLTGSAAEAALHFMIKLDTLNDGYHVTGQDFDLGNVAFQPMSFSEFRAYKPYPLSVKKYSGFEWGCILMPKGPEGDNISTLDTLLVAMNERTDKEQLAWDLLKTLTYEEEVQSEIFNYSEGISVLKKVTESDQTLQRLIESPKEAQNLNLTVLSNAVERAVVAPRFRNLKAAKAEVDRAVEAIIDGDGNISTEQIIWNRSINQFLKK